MAYSATIRMVKGDTLPELVLSLKDSNEAALGKVLDQEDSDTFAPVDISGGTVRVRIRQIGTETILKTITTTITITSLWHHKSNEISHELLWCYKNDVML